MFTNNWKPFQIQLINFISLLFQVSNYPDISEIIARKWIIFYFHELIWISIYQYNDNELIHVEACATLVFQLINHICCSAQYSIKMSWERRKKKLQLHTLCIQTTPYLHVYLRIIYKSIQTKSAENIFLLLNISQPTNRK